MTELIQNCKTFYDFAAVLLLKLKQISSACFYREESVDSLPIPSEMERDIEFIFDELRHYSSSDGNSLSKQISQKPLPDFFVNWFLAWQLKDLFRPVYELLHRLSRALNIKDVIEYYADNYPDFESLNQNARETGILILPFVSAINQPIESDEKEPDSGEEDNYNEEEKKYTWADSRLHLQLNNIYYTEVERLTTKSGRQLRIINHIIKQAIRKTCLDQLVVAVSPISRNDYLNIEVSCSHDRASENSFAILGLKNSEHVHSRIQSAFLAACKEKADVLMFPEMLGDATTCNSDYWDNLSDYATEAGFAKKPSLILTPTWWHEHKNVVHVFDEGAAPLFDQQKQFPFDCDFDCNGETVHASEDIRNPNSIIHVLHIDGIGRIMIPICKDFLMKDYRDIMLGELQATILLIPSFSFGSTQFNLSMPEAMQYGCYEIWINSCSALWQNEKNPSYVGIAASPFADSDARWLYHLIPKCNGFCGEANDACLFLVAIDLGEGKQMCYKHAACPTPHKTDDRKITDEVKK